MAISKISEGTWFTNGTKILSLLCDSDADFANLPTGVSSVQLADGSYSGKAAPGSTARVSSTGVTRELNPTGVWADVETTAETIAKEMAAALTTALTTALSAAQIALYDSMGAVPHTLSLTDDDNTTLTAALTERAGEAQSPAVSLADGNWLYAGDKVELTATPGEGYTSSVTFNGGAVELDESNKAVITISTGADVDIVCVGAEVEPAG